MCRSRAGLVRAFPGAWTLPSLRSQNGAGGPSLQYRAPHASASQFSVLATLSPGSQPPEVLASVACVGGPWSRHLSSRLRCWPGPLGPRRLRSALSQASALQVGLWTRLQSQLPPAQFPCKYCGWPPHPLAFICPRVGEASAPRRGGCVCVCVCE